MVLVAPCPLPRATETPMSPDQPTPDASLEQRRNPRVDLFREIACAGDGIAVRSQVADLSVGGMFVDTLRTPFQAGNRVTVRFSLHPQEPPLTLDAEVGYVQEGIGLGVRFVDLPEPERERIAAYVDEAVRRKGAGGPPLRKSARVTVGLPIRVRGARPDGGAFDEATSLVTLSTHGACVLCAHVLEVGTRLRLETAGGHEFLGNVVWVGSKASRSAGQVGVQCRGLAQSLGFRFP
jgi:hypothetical protein